MYFNSTKYYSLILCCLVAPFSLLAKDVRTGVDTHTQKPLSFIENNGQLSDQHNRPRADIQYQLTTPGMNMFVGKGQLHYQFSKITKQDASLQKDAQAISSPTVDNYRVDVTLIGANPHAQVVSEEKQSYFENYYLSGHSADGITASAYNRIVYKNVYPHIDWTLYIKNGKVEYDFIVHPGGNPADIQLKYDGATALNIAADGSVAATTPLGSINEQTPYAYETKSGKAVSSKFILRDNILSFATGQYQGDLTIDPALLWATYFGGTATDEGTAVATDGTGNAYLVGYTASAGLATTGAFQMANGGGTYDAFISKYNTSGVIQWTTYYGGTGSDQATGVACDAMSNVYMTGNTTTATGLSTTGTYQANNGGNTDAFLVKFNSAGARQWATYFGGANNDFANSVICGTGNVYIGGSTNSASAIATSGSYQAVMAGTSDAFIAKFSNSTGAITWATYYGGIGTDAIYGIATDLSGNVFATGQTSSTNAIATTGAYQTTLNGSTDAFVVKFSSAGVRQWGTYYGGSGTEQANGIAANLNGNIGIVGSTASSDKIATAPAYQSTYANGFSDAFAAMFNTSGGIIWGGYFGGEGLDYGQSVAFDAANNLYMTGGTYSNTGIAPAGAYQAANGGAEDAFLVKFTSFGQYLYSTYYGGTGFDIGYGVSASPTNSRIYVAGATGSSNAIATTGSAQATYGGGADDAFLIHFDRDTNVVINQYFTDTLLCQGGSFTVPYTTNFNFHAGNTFTMQLSDATGSFASPTVIGTTTANASGTIPCTIPAITPTGTGYRMRIVAANPAITSPDDNYNIDIISTLPPSTASNSSSAICTGGSIDLFDTASYIITSYSWTGPNGFTSTQQNPVISDVTTDDAGTYIVTTNHVSCPSVTASTDVVINSVAPATPTVTYNTPVCAGGTLNLSASSTTSGLTYGYSGPNGFTSSMQNPTITNLSSADSGYYFVTDTLNGCASAADTVLIAVNQYVTPTITISTSNDTSCAGQEVVLNATITDGGNDPQYQWMVDTSHAIGAITNIYGSPDFGNGDTLYCILMSSAACLHVAADTSNMIVLIIDPNLPPIVSITTADTNIFPGQFVTFTTSVTNGGTGTTYQWMVNGIIQTNTLSTFTTNLLNDGDVVTVLVHSNLPCASPDSATSNAVTIHYFPAGLKNISAAFKNITLYPNPNQGNFVIKGELNETSNATAAYEILNVQGQVIYKDNIDLQNGAFNKPVTLDAAVPDGIYTIRVIAEGQSSVIRFTLQR